jgi:Putative transposase, YhgA-like
MSTTLLTQAQYEALKKKLHHAHDKIWKIIFSSPSAFREYVEKVILPQLPNVSFDLDHLVLDNTSYVNQRLEPFYSDLVYWTTMTDQNGTKKPIKIALLLEHKSKMPSQLLMRLQLLEYIVALKIRNYDEDTDETLFVLPNVFNQFDKDWALKPFRSLYADLSPFMKGFIPEFGALVTNLQNFSAETIDAFEKHGELRAGMIAMKEVRNKQFLLDNFEDIFVFLQRHPNKTALRNQLVTYVLGMSSLSKDELEDLITHIFSPPLKEEVMTQGTGFIAVAAQESAEKTRKEEQEKARINAEKVRKEARLIAIQLEKRSLMMRLWKKGVAADFIADVTEVELAAVEKLIKGFNDAKTYIEEQGQKRISNKKLLKWTHLTEEELAVLLKILKEQK